MFTNFRGVVLSGHIAKFFERVLLKRLLRVARGVDEAQAVTNAPVDCRCQLHLLYDIILANSGRVWLMALDITRGFPSTSRALTATALRRHGVVLPVLWWIITPGPSLRTMLSGPQDWSFGGGIPR